jgi:hypothetical protein
MRLALFIVLPLLALAGCSFSSSDPSPPAQHSTIVVPPGSVVTH